MSRQYIVATLLIASIITLLGQSRLGSSQTKQDTRPPVFRTGVEAVQIDVFVTDEHDNPVTGLTANDFEVFENGDPQLIKTFTPVSKPLEHSEPSLNAAESDIQTNQREYRHVYLILLAVDDANAALRTRYVVRKFITEYFGDNDIAAVVAAGALRTQDTQDFTSNKRLLLAALDKYSGGDSIVKTPRAEAQDLWELMELMARIPGGRKSVLLVGRIRPLDPYGSIDYRGGVMGVDGEYAHAALAAATSANVRFYPIDPSGVVAGGTGGLGGDNKVFPQNAGLLPPDARALASLTGGRAHTSGNDYAAFFERVVQDTSTYYVIGFDSTIRRKQGRHISLEVKVKRPGLKVRSRSGYIEQLDYIMANMPPEPNRTPPEAALASPLANTGIPMRVFAAPFRRSGRDATVALAVEVDASQLVFDETDGRLSAPFELRHLATDTRAKIHPEFRYRTMIRLTKDAFRRVTTGGLRLVSQFDLPSGRYQLRVASASASRSGSVVYDLEVPYFDDGPLTLSGISLTTLAAADTLTLRPDQNRRTTEQPRACRARVCESTVVFQGTLGNWTDMVGRGDALLLREVLPAPPTTVRDFGQDETVVLYAEVYDNNKRVKADPPYAINITVKLAKPDGEVVRLLSAHRQSLAARRPSGGHGFTLQFPLEHVETGSYVLQVEALSGKEPTHHAARSIPVRVK